MGYTPSPSDKGSSISVQVTGSKVGYQSSTQVSASTVVAPADPQPVAVPTPVFVDATCSAPARLTLADFPHGRWVWSWNGGSSGDGGESFDGVPPNLAYDVDYLVRPVLDDGYVAAPAVPQWTHRYADPGSCEAAGPAFSRWSGADRFGTSVAISKGAFKSAVDVAYVANGLNFPDALAGAAVAGRDGAPVVMVTATSIPDVVRAELTRLAPKRIVVLGGTGVVSAAVANQLKSYLR